MKKEIITAIAGMALIAGCTKEAQPTPTQAVTFGIASITSGSVVKWAMLEMCFRGLVNANYELEITN